MLKDRFNWISFQRRFNFFEDFKSEVKGSEFGHFIKRFKKSSESRSALNNFWVAAKSGRETSAANMSNYFCTENIDWLLGDKFYNKFCMVCKSNPIDY